MTPAIFTRDDTAFRIAAEIGEKHPRPYVSFVHPVFKRSELQGYVIVINGRRLTDDQFERWCTSGDLPCRR